MAAWRGVESGAGSIAMPWRISWIKVSAWPSFVVISYGGMTVARSRKVRAGVVVGALIFLMGQTGPCPIVEPVPGQSCWDVDNDGNCDALEDVNNDGVCDALDCQGLQGEKGEQGEDGQNGQQGIPGQQGLQGIPGQDGQDGQDGSDATVTEGTGINVNSLEVSLDTDFTDGLYWKLNGNSGTTAGTNFLGTTDNMALELHVNNSRALRIEPDATSPNLIGGFNGNSVSGGVVGAAISGGGLNGFENTVTGDHGTVGGGRSNQAGIIATVAGGINNAASGERSVVGGGTGNTASSSCSVVAGGDNNMAMGGSQATVGGGHNNTSNAQGATIPGGEDNTASGRYSFAAGRKASAIHKGAFVWGDSAASEIASSAEDQFTARTAGGVRFFSDAAATTGVILNPGSGSWSSISDRNTKENFAPVDTEQILARLAPIPIKSWNYKSQGPTIRHIGPTAQDFHAAFSVGKDEKHITTIDADGVALAAIQGLYKMVKEQEKRIAELERQLHNQK